MPVVKGVGRVATRADEAAGRDDRGPRRGTVKAAPVRALLPRSRFASRGGIGALQGDARLALGRKRGEAAIGNHPEGRLCQQTKQPSKQLMTQR